MRTTVWAVAAIKLEHTTEIEAKEEDQEKEITAKDRLMLAKEKKLQKEQAGVAKAHSKEVAALHKDLEVSVNNYHCRWEH